MSTLANPFTSVLWRRMITQMYACVREEQTADPATAWRNFRAARDDLFRFHPRSPLNEAQRANFTGLDYYAYNPVWRVMGRIDTDVKYETFQVDSGEAGQLDYTRAASVHFAIDGEPAQLSLFWIEGYGGGLFLPFMDVTNGRRTFRDGRYLYDTIKGADLGVGMDEIVLDFNFAYNPICAYDADQTCLPIPEENKLPFAVTVGELAFT